MIKKAFKYMIISICDNLIEDIYKFTNKTDANIQFKNELDKHLQLDETQKKEALKNKFAFTNKASVNYLEF